MPREAESIRVNLQAVVNKADIRREEWNGREYIVIPSYSLPANVVMNNILYPAEEIDRSYQTLEDTPAPLGHPMLDGEYISARHPVAINDYHVGASNRNVEKRGNRIYLEKWLSPEVASRTEDGRKLLSAIAAGEPIHTSTGVFMRQVPARDNEDGYEWVAADMVFDHDAILLGEIGAATPEQGVGMMVNTHQARMLTANLGERILDRENSAWRDNVISEALRKRFGRPDSWVCLSAYDDRRVIYSTPEGSFYIDYLILDGRARLEGEPMPAESETAYFARNSIFANLWQFMRNALSSEPVTPTEPSEDQDMTPEELKAVLDEQAEKMTQAVNAAVSPVAERLQKLETELAANSEQALAGKREAAAVALGVEAETLSGMTANQLDAVIAKATPAAPLLHGMPTVNREALADYDKPVA